MHRLARETTLTRMLFFHCRQGFTSQGTNSFSNTPVLEEAWCLKMQKLPFFEQKWKKVDQMYLFTLGEISHYLEFLQDFEMSYWLLSVCV